MSPQGGPGQACQGLGEDIVCKWHLPAEFPSVTHSCHFLLCSSPNSWVITYFKQPLEWESRNGWRLCLISSRGWFLETWGEGLRIFLILREQFLCGWLGFLTQKTALLKGCIAAQFSFGSPGTFSLTGRRGWFKMSSSRAKGALGRCCWGMGKFSILEKKENYSVAVRQKNYKESFIKSSLLS